MTKDNIISIVEKCSCGVEFSTHRDAVLHYAYVHHNIEPLLEYHQDEIAVLRKELQLAKQSKEKSLE